MYLSTTLTIQHTYRSKR